MNGQCSIGALGAWPWALLLLNFQRILLARVQLSIALFWCTFKIFNLIVTQTLCFIHKRILMACLDLNTALNPKSLVNGPYFHPSTFFFCSSFLYMTSSLLSWIVLRPCRSINSTSTCYHNEHTLQESNMTLFGCITGVVQQYHMGCSLYSEYLPLLDSKLPFLEE